MFADDADEDDEDGAAKPRVHKQLVLADAGMPFYDVRYARVLPTRNVFSIRQEPKACAKSTDAAASVAHRRRKRLARAGRGMRASRSDTRAASQAFECTHMWVSIWTKHVLTDDSCVLSTSACCF